MNDLQKLLDAYRQAFVTEREKGTYFEELICTYLRNEATYAICTARYPTKTSVQLCIVHMMRNSLSFASWKVRKEVAIDLKNVYRAATSRKPNASFRSSNSRGIEITRRSNSPGGVFGRGSRRSSTTRRKFERCLRHQRH